MTNNKLRLYVNELATQCHWARLALHELQTALKSSDIETAFLRAHTFIMCTGNVSKLLFSGEEAQARVKERTAQLRDELGLTQNMELKSRALRNALEHFDERLDEYADPDNRLIVDQNVTNVPLANAISVHETAVQLRNLDETSLTFSFLAVDYPLATLKEEMLAIAEVADAWLSK